MYRLLTEAQLHAFNGAMSQVNRFIFIYEISLWGDCNGLYRRGEKGDEKEMGERDGRETETESERRLNRETEIDSDRERIF